MLASPKAMVVTRSTTIRHIKEASSREEQSNNEQGRERTERTVRPLETSANKYFITRIINDYLKTEKHYNFTEPEPEPLQEEDVQTYRYYEEEKNITIRFNYVTVDEKNPLEGLGNTVNAIRDIYSCKEEGCDIELWVDTHGGFRDITFIMASLLSLLKSEGIEPKKKYGVQFGNNNAIIEQPIMFEMFDFVTGMNDFFNYGSANVLKGKDYSKSNKKDLLVAMDKIAQGTQFCDPYLYKDGVIDLINYKKSVSEPHRINDEIDIFESNIFNDFKDILDVEPEGVDLDFAIIKRCLEKELYQQTLTFIENLMPKYFYEKRILYYDKSQERTITDTKNKNNSSYVDNKNYVFDANLVSKYIKGNHDQEITSKLKDEKEKNVEIKDENEIKDLKKRLIVEYFSRRYVEEENLCCIADTIMQDDIYKIFDDNLFVQMFKQPSNSNGYSVSIGNAEKKQVSIKTDVGVSQENYVGEVFLMHKALKDCRNAFNHGKESQDGNGKSFIKRAKTKDIENVIRRYIKKVNNIKINKEEQQS